MTFFERLVTSRLAYAYEGLSNEKGGELGGPVTFMRRSRLSL